MMALRELSHPDRETEHERIGGMLLGMDGVSAYLSVSQSWDFFQGKRVACEEGSDGFSDLFQENSMLLKENDTLRMRVKAMQETIDHLNTRVTQLLTNGVNLLLTKTGERPLVAGEGITTDLCVDRTGWYLLYIKCHFVVNINVKWIFKYI